MKEKRKKIKNETTGICGEGICIFNGRKFLSFMVFIQAVQPKKRRHVFYASERQKRFFFFRKPFLLILPNTSMLLAATNFVLSQLCLKFFITYISTQFCCLSSCILHKSVIPFLFYLLSTGESQTSLTPGTRVE